MTLHKEIIAILKESGVVMTLPSIADKIKVRKNYIKKDGSDITVFQINGRIKSYPRIFTCKEYKVGLVEWGEIILETEFQCEMIKIIKGYEEEAPAEVIASTIGQLNSEYSNITAQQIMDEAKKHPNIFTIKDDSININEEWVNSDFKHRESSKNVAVYLPEFMNSKNADAPETKDNPIKSFGVSHFKGYNDLQTSQLKPLTLIFGPNSSGKSSFLHSLLYFSNALTSNELSPNYMKISGDSVDLGGFEQLIYNGNIQNKLIFRIDLNINNMNEKLSKILGGVKNVTLIIEITQPTSEIEKLVEDDSSGWFPVGANDFYSNGKPVVSKYEIITDTVPLISFDAAESVPIWIINSLNIENNLMKTIVEQAISKKMDSLEEVTTEIIADGLIELASQLYSKTNTFIPRNLYYEKSHLNHFYGENIICENQLDSDSTMKQTLTLSFPPLLNELLSEIYELLHSQFGQIQYLGPTRLYPQRHILSDNENVDDVNYFSGGEFAWYALIRNNKLREKVNVWLSSSNKLKTKYQLISRELVDINGVGFFNLLERANNDTLIGSDGDFSGRVNREIETGVLKGIKDLVLIDKNANTIVGHKDVGYGISQVIPVLVSAYGNKNKIVLIEQPEIHLHPALQAELGDVFVENAIGENNNTFIIETHSEHLLRKLQVLVANGKLNKDKLAVYYISKVNGSSKIKEMELDENGFFKEAWPEGFFDESFELTKQLISAKKK